jgi:hypothetical protein
VLADADAAAYGVCFACVLLSLLFMGGSCSFALESDRLSIR